MTIIKAVYNYCDYFYSFELKSNIDNCNGDLNRMLAFREIGELKLTDLSKEFVDSLIKDGILIHFTQDLERLRNGTNDSFYLINQYKKVVVDRNTGEEYIVYASNNRAHVLCRKKDNAYETIVTPLVLALNYKDPNEKVQKIDYEYYQNMIDFYD
ncbi:hypothetical protein [Hydrogenimonas thermophila]|uniref:Uncharacterized protein n=1 Tax=Hydrogenimonas thermophila TaxID=223786 RepID=A0A1I5N8L9_9BACT|nr:hypothetical protein [Hydrogenimonas thermophila]SFP18057.1 hypothetical protein SAMN05216234_10911 [Hydrogenimonas thermophila]